MHFFPKRLLAISGSFLVGCVVGVYIMRKRSLRDRFELIFDLEPTHPVSLDELSTKTTLVGIRLHHMSHGLELMAALLQHADALSRGEPVVLPVDKAVVSTIHLVLHKLMFSGFLFAQRLGFLASLDE